MFGFDLITLIQTIGYAGIFGIVFAETGLLIGFFLPGDSLLFTAGFLASQGWFDIGVLGLGTFLAAVIGDTVGYHFGRRIGPALFRRPDARFFKTEYVERAAAFFAVHGGKSIILARFLPVIRTFTPILAGVGHMRYRAFLAYNVIGGALWTLGLTGAGYWLGQSIPNVDRYLIPIVLGIILVSSAPTLWHVLRSRR